MVRCAGEDGASTASFSCVTAEGGDSGGKGGGGVAGACSSSMGPRISAVHGDMAALSAVSMSEMLAVARADTAALLMAKPEFGGEGVQEMGESTISPSNPSSLSSSTSHRHLAAFLVHFAGGGETGGMLRVGERVVTVGGASGSKGGGSITGGAGGGRD